MTRRPGSKGFRKPHAEKLLERTPSGMISYAVRGREIELLPVQGPVNPILQGEERALYGEVYTENPPLSLEEVQEIIQRDIDESAIELVEGHEENVVPGLVLRRLVSRYAEHMQPYDTAFALHYIEELEEHTSLDSLTGALTRKEFERDMFSLFAERARAPETAPFCLGIIDIDFFKKVNSEGGHQGGDIALQKLVEIVQSSLRENDRIYRYGGEEFTLVLEGVSAEEGARILESVRQNVQEKLCEAARAAGASFSSLQEITISIGVAEPPTISWSPSSGVDFSTALQAHAAEMFQMADDALYAAKKGIRNQGVGRNRVEVYGSDLSAAKPTVEQHTADRAEIRKETRTYVEQSTGITEQTAVTREEAEGILEEFARDLKSFPEDTKLYPINPVEGLQMIFTRQGIQEQLLAQPRDVVRLQDALERFSALMLQDTLTELPNRKAYEKALKRFSQEASRSGIPFTLVRADSDHFKSMNDRLGHYIGDIVLRAYGNVLRNMVRADEEVFRVSGDEFAFILHETEPTAVMNALQRFRETIRKEVYPEAVRLLELAGHHDKIGLLQELRKSVDPDGEAAFSMSFGAMSGKVEGMRMLDEGRENARQAYDMTDPLLLDKEADACADVSKGIQERPNVRMLIPGRRRDNATLVVEAPFEQSSPQ